jgi:hydrogenase/urease accessory protein HupE
MRTLMRSPSRLRLQELTQPLAAWLVVTALCLIGFLGGSPARAHEVRPAVATIIFDESGTFDLTVSLNLEALLAGIGPDHVDTAQSPTAGEYNRLRSLPPDELRAEFDKQARRFQEGVRVTFDRASSSLELKEVRVPATGDVGQARISEISLSGPVPPGAKLMVWAYDPQFGHSAIRARKAGAEASFYSGYVLSGSTSEPIPVFEVSPQSAWSVFRNYVVVGFEHIVPKGLDHILFVVGLFLLSPRLKPLLWQVTSFTLAHSVTLALGTLGVIQISPAIVEPLIAASIVYVAVENILTDRLQRWRPLVVFCFGLLHGLGFAGVLEEIGLSPTHFVTGLIAFNVGVELGQLPVVALCFLAVGLWFQSKSWYRSGITVPASLIIALIGGYWFIERVSGS